jgi:lipoyl(octanoyl) transferase
MHLGRLSYQETLTLQQKLVSKYKNLKGGSNCEVGTIVTVEHPPVYTLGRREQIDAFSTSNIKAEIVKVKRGGLVTFHGPGQIVCYPILSLKLLKVGVRAYVHSLEKAVVAVCARFGVEAQTTENVGVWINEDKICAIGIQVSHGVAWHGLSLNCNVDLSWFEHILPCGLEGKGVTSLSSATGLNISPDDVKSVLVKNLMDELELVELQ